MKKPLISFSEASYGLRSEIRTERLYIRSYEETDLKESVDLYGDPILTKYFDHGKPRSKEETERMVYERGILHSRSGLGFGLFSIFHQDNGAFMGQIDLLPTEAPGEAEIGCIFLRKYHNQGFPLEALSALIGDYTEALNSRKNGLIAKILATAHPKNYASQRLIRGLGLTYERSEMRFDGQTRFLYSVNKP